MTDQLITFPKKLRAISLRISPGKVSSSSGGSSPSPGPRVSGAPQTATLPDRLAEWLMLFDINGGCG
ncbi:hypothetical protein E2C01_066184 [Portunus trituberculatus]|uniref:Uncharacterized protein n=1 Tax=Portunus trituberculatus TaxID=210409 RepID=A0A5B7HP32_PORTR|nr:hypothetical protein [Portunus trituberculatus]